MFQTGCELMLNMSFILYTGVHLLSDAMSASFALHYKPCMQLLESH